MHLKTRITLVLIISEKYKRIVHNNNLDLDKDLKQFPSSNQRNHEFTKNTNIIFSELRMVDYTETVSGFKKRKNSVYAIWKSSKNAVVW